MTGPVQQPGEAMERARRILDVDWSKTSHAEEAVGTVAALVARVSTLEAENDALRSLLNDVALDRAALAGRESARAVLSGAATPTDPAPELVRNPDWEPKELTGATPGWECPNCDYGIPTACQCGRPGGDGDET